MKLTINVLTMELIALINQKKSQAELRLTCHNLNYCMSQLERDVFMKSLLRRKMLTKTSLDGSIMPLTSLINV